MDERAHPWRRRARLGAASAAAIALVVVGIADGESDGGVRVTADEHANRTGGWAPYLPGGPTDGKATLGLPVVVDPPSGLADGDDVSVSGSGFTPGIRVGIVTCAQSARHGGGVEHCDTSGVVYSDVGADGTFRADVAARRFPSTPAEGQIDCGVAPATCVVAAGNLSDYDESGAADVSFAPGPPPPAPQLALGLGEPVADGDIIRVRGSGFQAGATTSLWQCDARLLDATGRSSLGCTVAASATPAADGTFEVPVMVRRYLGPDPGAAFGAREVDCAPDRCVLHVQSYAGTRAATVGLHVDPHDTTRAAARTATAFPSRGLRDGVEVAVRGAGFPPTLPVVVLLCSDEPLCVPVSESVEPDASGLIALSATLPSTIPLAGDTIDGEAGASGSGGSVDCRRVACALQVRSESAPAYQARVPLDFAG